MYNLLLQNSYFKNRLENDRPSQKHLKLKYLYKRSYEEKISELPITNTLQSIGVKLKSVMIQMKLKTVFQYT